MAVFRDLAERDVAEQLNIEKETERQKLLLCERIFPLLPAAGVFGFLFAGSTAFEQSLEVPFVARLTKASLKRFVFAFTTLCMWAKGWFWKGLKVLLPFARSNSSILALLQKTEAFSRSGLSLASFLILESCSTTSRSESSYDTMKVYGPYCTGNAPCSRRLAEKFGTDNYYSKDLTTT